jgi:hypothetical protein
VRISIFGRNHSALNRISRPTEMATAMSAEGDLIQLSNVARMAHRYHYITIEAWALNALLANFSSQPVTSVLTHALVQITEVAVLCEDKLLLGAVRLPWKDLIGERKDLAIAINMMESFGIWDLEGLAYHAMLLEGREYWESDLNLSWEQRIWLLSGHYNLTEASEALADNPPVFIHNPRCNDEENCNADWGNLWELITSINPLVVGTGNGSMPREQ